ncbi:MAG TPA: hypothetical protein DCX41_04740 [Aequorivita sp.]|nr:hypothetical protein [Aequorivita sp.]|tara:strand:+ start:7959 stop:9386 length:1428 start_codon:yes stop_codon:yes gene_type:complete
MKKTLATIAAVTGFFSTTSCGYLGGNTDSEIDLFPIKGGKEYQYIDRDGKIVINPQFGQATVFRDGLALIRTSSEEPKYGYINPDGRYEINAQYKNATVFAEGLAWVIAENAAPTAISKSGEIKFTLQDAEYVKNYSNGLAAFAIIGEDGNLKWGFVDAIGKVIITPQFSNVDKFSENRCAVQNKDGKWGYIEKDGKIIINLQFDSAQTFENEKAIVKSNDKWGVIDAQGKYTINPQFTAMTVDSDSFLIEQEGKWGWCDTEGKILINPQFTQAFPFGNNKLAAVESGDKWGFVNKEGKMVINPQFDQALPFNGNLALVKSGDKAGLINKEGKYLVNPLFEDVPTDLILYLLNRSSFYESVATDYFNIGAITSAITFENPEGFTINTTFEDVMKKYKLSEDDFSKYETEYKVLNDSKISNDATYSFYVVGSPYKNSSVTYQGFYGPYERTEKVFNATEKPQMFAIRPDIAEQRRG